MSLTAYNVLLILSFLIAVQSAPSGHELNRREIERELVDSLQSTKFRRALAHLNQFRKQLVNEEKNRRNTNIVVNDGKSSRETGHHRRNTNIIVNDVEKHTTTPPPDNKEKTKFQDENEKLEVVQDDDINEMQLIVDNAEQQHGQHKPMNGMKKPKDFRRHSSDLSEEQLNKRSVWDQFVFYRDFYRRHANHQKSQNRRNTNIIVNDHQRNGTRGIDTNIIVNGQNGAMSKRHQRRSEMDGDKQTNRRDTNIVVKDGSHTPKRRAQGKEKRSEWTKFYKAYMDYMYNN
ncbi:hypothetical protein SNEBB_000256 [Seison nebaliae]|nr:hypothetical protein SNEBB_000256 [Seison nebaliae]